MNTTMTRDTLSQMTPQKALDTLMEGNARYTASQHEERDLMAQTRQTGDGQYPYAVVLGCIDSRVPPEVVFDLGIGDIFSVRVAGNFVNEDILGSMEFACKVVGSKLILVLGHTSCGAVKGAFDNVELGHITGLVNKIKPAVEWVRLENAAASDDLDEIARRNVHMNIEAIRERSDILAELEQAGDIEIVGGMYDVHTGAVTLLDPA